MDRREFLKILSQAAAAASSVLAPSLAQALCPPQNFSIQGGKIVSTAPGCESYVRKGIFGVFDWETGYVAKNGTNPDGVWVRALRDKGYVDKNSFKSSMFGAADTGPTSDYDVRVVKSYQAPTTPNGPGEIVYPRTGNYFLMAKMHKEKDYRGVNGNPDDTTIQDGSYHYDKPRTMMPMSNPNFQFNWLEEIWWSYSLYLPSNWENNYCAVRDNRGEVAFGGFFPAGWNTQATSLSLSYQIPWKDDLADLTATQKNQAYWHISGSYGKLREDQPTASDDPKASAFNVRLSNVLEDQDPGHWTDWVFRIKCNPYSQARTEYGVTYPANTGILEIWKSYGPVINSKGDRAMKKVHSWLNRPFGNRPNSASDQLQFSAFRQYFYSWKRTSVNSVVKGPVMNGYDAGRVGRAALGAGFRDVHPTMMSQP